MSRAIEREFTTGLPANLVPVFLATGIAIYFAAPSEPTLLAPFLFAVIFVFSAFRLGRHGASWMLICGLAIMFTGMVAAKYSVYRNATPQIERQLTTSLEATVIAVDQNRRGSPRLLVRPHRLGDLPPSQIPRLIRVSAAKGGQTLQPGDRFSGLVRLLPVSGPAFAGSYDFGFHAWFRGLGGSGFVMGKPDKRAQDFEVLGYGDRFRVFVNRIRTRIENRIHQALPPETAGVVVALTTGNKTGIDKSTSDILRRTGLAHILAISGMHMAIVSLALIWLVRFVVTRFPSLVMNYPVKKWAVAVGFAGATCYLFLSGAGVATQRAWIMISVMLFAVLLDRRALTMRSVAVAASLILLIRPQSLLAPGFQMSFAAVSALVAGYEWLNTRRRNRSGHASRLTGPDGIRSGALGVGLRYAGGLFATSLIAGTATAFVAAWHFHQVAPLGLVANLLAMPVFGLFVMPGIMLALAAMPFGYDPYVLAGVELAIGWVLAIASAVADVSPSGITGIMPAHSLSLFALAISVLCLCRTPIRLFAVVPLMAAFVMGGKPATPDVLISENGRAVGLPTGSGLLLPWPRRNPFITEIWAKAYDRGIRKPMDIPPGECGRDLCKIPLKSSLMLHLVYDPSLLASSCETADILAAPRLWWVNCRSGSPALVLRRGDFERYGSHAIYIDPKSAAIAVRTGIARRDRPWSRKVTPK